MAVGLEKKGGRRKEGLGFCTVQAYHRRFVTRTVGDASYHQRFVTRTGGDNQHHQRFVFRTGGDKPVQYKTPTPSSSHHLSSPTRWPHISPPLLRPDFAEILKKPRHS